MSRTVFEGKIVTLEILDEHWEIVRHAPAVAVIVEREGKVLGVRQHRPPIDRATWELPAGLIDPGETPSQAAARELAEEAGLGGTLDLVTEFYTSPGFTDEKIYLFRASNLETAHAQPDPGEDLTVDWRDPAEVWQAVARGDVHTSAVTLLGIQQLLLDRGVRP